MLRTVELRLIYMHTNRKQKVEFLFTSERKTDKDKMHHHTALVRLKQHGQIFTIRKETKCADTKLNKDVHKQTVKTKWNNLPT